VLVGNGVHQAVCSAAQPRRSCPAINRLSARVWGDRRFSDASHRVFATSAACASARWSTPCRSRAGRRVPRVQRVIAEHDWRIEFPIEVRVAPPTTGGSRRRTRRASGYIAVHRYWRPTRAYFAAVEEVMLAHAGAALGQDAHARCGGLRERYPRFDDFTALRDRLDPHAHVPQRLSRPRPRR
jgi:hypothetical protein